MVRMQRPLVPIRFLSGPLLFLIQLRNIFQLFPLLWLIYWMQVITTNYFLTRWRVYQVLFLFFVKHIVTLKHALLASMNFLVFASVFFFLFFPFLIAAEEEVLSNYTWLCIFSTFFAAVDEFSFHLKWGSPCSMSLLFFFTACDWEREKTTMKRVSPVCITVCLGKQTLNLYKLHQSDILRKRKDSYSLISYVMKGLSLCHIAGRNRERRPVSCVPVTTT